jgi:hypothetical protein
MALLIGDQDPNGDRITRIEQERFKRDGIGLWPDGGAYLLWFRLDHFGIEDSCCLP